MRAEGALETVSASLRRPLEAPSRDPARLLDAVVRLHHADEGADALSALLAALRDGFECSSAALVRREEDGATVVVQACGKPQEGDGTPEEIFSSPLLEAGPPGRLSTPLRLEAPHGPARAPITGRGAGNGARHALVCLDPDPRTFAEGDLALLARLSEIAASVLAGHDLAEDHALLRALVDGASASISIADARDDAMPLTYVNAAFETLTGWPAAEALGRNCRFLSAEAEDSAERARLRDVVRERGQGRFELLNRRRDGATFWTELSIHAAPGRDGRPRHMVATQADVSDRRRAERARDLARNRLVGALASLREGFLLLDAQDRVVFANEPYRDLFGDGKQPWTPGRGFVDIWTGAREAEGAARDPARAEAEARLAAMRRGRSEREETLPDGRVLLIAEQPTRDGGCISIAHDVTLQKTTERMLAARVAAIDAARDAIAVTDEEGRFVYMNASHRRMFGIGDAYAAPGLRWQALYTPERAEWLERNAMPVLRETGGWQGEIKGRRRDGGVVELEVSLTLNPGGGLVCVSRDIGGRRRDEAERDRLRDQLHAAQRHEAVGVLAAGVAHDFNNLISAVSGSASLLLAALPEGAAERAHAERILAAGARATQLVSRLHDLGRRAAPARETDLRGPLREAMELAATGMPPGVELRVEAPEGPLAVMLDSTDFLQVLINLVINARDAIGGEGGAIRVVLDAWDGGQEAAPGAAEVRLGAPPAGPCARLRVRDDGCGIPPARLREVFEPYFTTKGGAGTGLGLSMVASLVQASGGALRVSSAPGEGTCFEILWPLATEGAAQSSARPGKADAPPRFLPVAAGGGAAGVCAPLRTLAGSPGPAPDLSGRMVLVVDDDPVTAEALAALIESAGAEAAVCGHPDDALEALAADRQVWSLLITDFEMPDRTGAEVAEAARGLAPGLPVLLCTGFGFDAVRREGAEGLFDAILPKPVDPQRLLAAAARAVAAREPRAAPRPEPADPEAGGKEDP